jgi:hypothetical protein
MPSNIYLMLIICINCFYFLFDTLFVKLFDWQGYAAPPVVHAPTEEPASTTVVAPAVDLTSASGLVPLVAVRNEKGEEDWDTLQTHPCKFLVIYYCS